MKKELENAVSSTVHPPKEVVQAFPKPDASKLTFWPIKSLSKEGMCSHVAGNLSGTPFKFHLDDVQSKFVRFSVAFDLKHVTNAEDYALLGLINIVWLQSPIKVNETYTMDASEVKRARLLSMLSWGSYLDDTTIRFDTDACADKYEEALKINQLTIFNTQVSVQLIKKEIKNFMGKILHLLNMKVDVFTDK